MSDFRSSDDWMEYRQYIVRKLEEQGEDISEIRDLVTGLRIDLATHQATQRMRASAWGAVMGAIPAGIGVLAIVLSGGL